MGLSYKEVSRFTSNYCKPHLFLVEVQSVSCFITATVRTNDLPSMVGPQWYLDMENSLVIVMRLVVVVVV